MDTMLNAYLLGTTVLLFMWTVMVLKGNLVPKNMYWAFLFIIAWPVIMPLYIWFGRPE